ncbi:MAG: ABC transporter ATP-binding protein [Planctomycetaceae bacterium]|nr:MAG: ABC transporter ATP-binding protein [Planctomycetaceae bacterium]
MTEPTASPAVPLLEAVAVTRYFEDGQVTALKDVSLQIDSGDYVALVGKSGSGKSTLLNLLGGLDHPTSGAIRYRGKDLSEFGDPAQFRSSELGFVFQSFHLISVLTAEQNVQMPMFESSLRAPERRERAAELLERVGLTHRARHLPQQLSVGERQRVAIARALANRPSLLLADEPTGNLDSSTAESIFALFDSLHADGMTLLLITHDPLLSERARRTWTLRDGRLGEADDDAKPESA